MDIIVPPIVKDFSHNYDTLTVNELKCLCRFMDCSEGYNKQDCIWNILSTLPYTGTLRYYKITSYITQKTFFVFYPYSFSYHTFKKCKNNYLCISERKTITYQYIKPYWYTIDHCIIDDRYVIPFLNKMKKSVDYLELREVYVQCHVLNLLPDIIHYMFKLLK